jgi:hypothetical protein
MQRYGSVGGKISDSAVTDSFSRSQQPAVEYQE